jgi:Ulp1 family protease
MYVHSNKQWRFIDHTDGPFQENGKDCGVFVAAHVYYSLRGGLLSCFSEDAVDRFREFMVAKLKFVRGEVTSDCDWDLDKQGLIKKI